MKKNYFLSGMLLFLGVLQNNFSQSQVYKTGFNTTTEQTEWQEYRLDVGTPHYKWTFESMATSEGSHSLSHTYPVGASDTTKDWFVSPELFFETGGSIDSLMYHFSGFGMPNPGDTIGIYLLTENRNPALAQKTLLHLFTDSTYNNDGVWYLLNAVNIPAASGSCYLAFRYETENNWLDVRFDRLVVSQSLPTQINQRKSNTVFQVFPNPANQSIWVSYNQSENYNSVMEIINALGSVEIVTPLTKPTQQVDVSNLIPGFYLVKVKNQVTKLIIGH